ncbi:heme exporter protein CcmB [uncultured Mitsuokella sp.]|uniref:heme exporter protein CcmB n=1 Tax=uncultured Mitsuokella sp. TaxID=453120 RepID=UPI0026DBF185|nr:heme exporter protein CcmB [uncultured Mitsuokella sp.]
MNGSIFQGVELVFRKELTLGLRFKAAWAAMFLFALTTLSCISLSLQGSALEPRLLAALFWVILFFSSLAGADRVFGDEDMAGTLLVLKVYGPSQAILLGKMLYTAFILLILAVFITPLFLIFMNGSAALPGLLLGTLAAGIWGIAAAGTLIASLLVGASVHSGLFSILMLPVILPVFIPAIALTAAAFGDGTASLSYLVSMILYDLILTVGASLLFDYLWYED